MAMQGRLGNTKYIKYLENLKEIRLKIISLLEADLTLYEAHQKAILIKKNLTLLPTFTNDEVTFLNEKGGAITNIIDFKARIQNFLKITSETYLLLNSLVMLANPTLDSKASSAEKLDTLIKWANILHLQDLKDIINTFAGFIYSSLAKDISFNFKDDEIVAITQLSFALSALDEYKAAAKNSVSSEADIREKVIIDAINLLPNFTLSNSTFVTKPSSALLYWIKMASSHSESMPSTKAPVEDATTSFTTKRDSDPKPTSY